MASNQAPSVAPGREELLKQQEELERKEEEIRHHEKTSSQPLTNVRAHNWPPLPKCCPVKPCFYHDIVIDIQTPFQRIVRLGYRIWIFYSFTLLLNVVGSLAYFVISANGLQFGLSIFQLILFTPCAFLLWYRPLYKAFQNDSSMNFMIFFFVQFAQIIFTGVLVVGLPGWSCGFVSGVDAVSKPNLPVGIIMFTVGALFFLNFLMQLFLLLKVHRFYRSSDANFAKARAELKRKKNAKNSQVQQTAVGIAAVATASQSRS